MRIRNGINMQSYEFFDLAVPQLQKPCTDVLWSWRNLYNSLMVICKKSTEHYLVMIFYYLRLFWHGL